MSSSDPTSAGKPAASSRAKRTPTYSFGSSTPYQSSKSSPENATREIRAERPSSAPSPTSSPQHSNSHPHSGHYPYPPYPYYPYPPPADHDPTSSPSGKAPETPPMATGHYPPPSYYPYAYPYPPYYPPPHYYYPGGYPASPPPPSPGGTPTKHSSRDTPTPATPGAATTANAPGPVPATPAPASYVPYYPYPPPTPPTPAPEVAPKTPTRDTPSRAPAVPKPGTPYYPPYAYPPPPSTPGAVDHPKPGDSTTASPYPYSSPYPYYAYSPYPGYAPAPYPPYHYPPPPPPEPEPAHEKSPVPTVATSPVTTPKTTNQRRSTPPADPSTREGPGGSRKKRRSTGTGKASISKVFRETTSHAVASAEMGSTKEVLFPASSDPDNAGAGTGTTTTMTTTPVKTSAATPTTTPSKKDHPDPTGAMMTTPVQPTAATTTTTTVTGSHDSSQDPTHSDLLTPCNIDRDEAARSRVTDGPILMEPLTPVDHEPLIPESHRTPSREDVAKDPPTSTPAALADVTTGSAGVADPATQPTNRHSSALRTPEPLPPPKEAYTPNAILATLGLSEEESFEDHGVDGTLVTPPAVPIPAGDDNKHAGMTRPGTLDQGDKTENGPLQNHANDAMGDSGGALSLASSSSTLLGESILQVPGGD